MRYYNIPIFVPHYGCPHDCVFCNQKHITGETQDVTAKRVKDIINEHLSTVKSENSRIEAAFFGGSFTAIDKDKQTELLEAAYSFVKEGRISGIRLSTRPDCIDDDIVERLVAYGVTAIELGVQSLDDDVLVASGRGHKSCVVKNAVDTIRKYPVELGLQMMTGLPGDTPQKSINTCKKIIELKPDCVRIYPTLVIKDTALEKLYRDAKYTPQSLDDAVSLVSQLMVLFRKNKIRVIRAGLAATDEISYGASLVAGPFHAAFGELAEGEIFYNRICEYMKNESSMEFLINPRDISKAIGNGKRNIKRFENQGKKVTFKVCEGIDIGDILPVKG